MENCFSSGVARAEGHCLRAGPRELGGHEDRRKIDVGQIAHRERSVSYNPEDQDRRHDQGCHDGAFDEEFRNIHLNSVRSQE